MIDVVVDFAGLGYVGVVVEGGFVGLGLVAVVDDDGLFQCNGLL